MQEPQSIPERQLTRQEIAEAKAELKALGEPGYLEMMSTINSFAAVGLSRAWRQTRGWRFATYIVGFGGWALVVTSVVLLIMRHWLAGIGLFAFDYIIVNCILHTEINYELGSRMMLLYSGLDSVLTEEPGTRENDTEP